MKRNIWLGNAGRPRPATVPWHDWPMIEIAVAAGVLLVVALVWWGLRDRLRSRPPAPRPLTSPLPEGAPRPGEIWWAEVPFEDSGESKHRPCLVLGLYRDGFHVLKITSRHRTIRQGHVTIPTRHWDPKAVKDSSLDLTARFAILGSDFDRKAGDIDDRTWKIVKRVHKN